MAPPPPARKFGAPLFFCSFTDSDANDEVVLGGGGGASKTGVANRLLLVKVDEEKATHVTGAHQCRLECDPSAEVHTGSLTTVNGVWVKGKPYFVAVLSGGDGLVKYQLKKSGQGGKKDGEEKETFNKLEINKSNISSFKQAAISSIASNNLGTQIAVGFDTGKIVIYEASKLDEVKEFNPKKHSQIPDKGGIMSLSFTFCGTKVAAVKGNGFAFVWDTAASGKNEKAASVTVFQSPVPGGMFRGCYSYDLPKSKKLFCMGLNIKGRSMLTSWSLEKEGKGKKLVLKRKVNAHKAALTALAGYSSLSPVRKGAVGSKGKCLVASASSEGEVSVYSLEHNLTCLVRVPNAHMIFTTCVNFSNDGSRLVSVSADAGARIVTVTKSGDQVKLEQNLMIALFMFLLVIFLYYFVL